MADQSGNQVFNALVIVALLTFAIKGVLEFRGQAQLQHLERVGSGSK